MIRTQAFVTFLVKYILKYTYDLTKKVAKASDYVYTFLFHCYLGTSSLDLVEKNLLHLICFKEQEMSCIMW